jgi:hypothetical protein
MSRLSAHQLDRRLEKLEAMPEASEAHVIIVTFEEQGIGEQLECRGVIYHRLPGEEDSMFKNRVILTTDAGSAPVVMFSKLNEAGSNERLH